MLENERLSIRLQGAALVATIKCAKITDFEKPGLHSELSKYASAHGFRLVVDMQNVHIIGSSGIGLLLSLNKEARAAGGKLAICHVADEILEMLKISHLLKVLPVHKDLDRAVQAVA
jgi:anti-sigma B factor antagonist